MFADLIEKLRDRRDLTEAEATGAMVEIMEGRATPAQIAGLLIGLSMKGEKSEEIVGLARTMRAQAVSLSRSFDGVFDTCGTGGDRLQTFNVSSMAALTIAACGVRVAKHGNRSVSSSCGSADLFEALGVDLSASVAVVERCLADVGIAFFFAPSFHPSMRYAAPTRRELGVRTAFNLLGPLTNPAGVRRQIVGVPGPESTDLVARSLGRLGSERVWVVHGADGLDEISPCGYTKITEFRDGVVRTFFTHPSDFGVRPTTLDGLQVRGRDESVAVARSLLAGQGGPAREFVLINAAAGLLVEGRVESLADGMTMASAALDEGRVAQTLEALVACSKGVGMMGGSAAAGREVSPPRPDLLAAIVAATRQSLPEVELRTPRAVLERVAAERTPRGGMFRDALVREHDVPVIAECKRRSPSKGVLRADYRAVDIAAAYERAGAAAVSVLTEPAFFDGSLQDLSSVRETVTLPILRKDFIVAEYQLVESRAHGADAVLLIVAALDDATLVHLIRTASALGLAALVEVHNAAELARALDAGGDIIGVNNRNLRTLDVDLEASMSLVDEIPESGVAVAESGIKTSRDLLALSRAGYNAFLVGESLVSRADPGDALETLLRIEEESVARSRR